MKLPTRIKIHDQEFELIGHETPSYSEQGDPVTLNLIYNRQPEPLRVSVSHFNPQVSWKDEITEKLSLEEASVVEWS